MFERFRLFMARFFERTLAKIPVAFEYEIDPLSKEESESESTTIGALLKDLFLLLRDIGVGAGSSSELSTICAVCI